MNYACGKHRPGVPRVVKHTVPGGRNTDPVWWLPLTLSMHCLLPTEMKYLGLVLEYVEQEQTHCILLVAHGVSEKAEWVADVAQVRANEFFLSFSRSFALMY